MVKEVFKLLMKVNMNFINRQGAKNKKVLAFVIGFSFGGVVSFIKNYCVVQEE